MFAVTSFYLDFFCWMKFEFLLVFMDVITVKANNKTLLLFTGVKSYPIAYNYPIAAAVRSNSTKGDFLFATY